MFAARIIGTTVVALLAGCGGGGQSGTNDTQVSGLTELVVTQTSASQLTLTALTANNAAVAAYCFKTDSAAPAASDACFQASNQKVISIVRPMNPYHVWTKDAANNVSANHLTGPCSAAGYSASNASLLPTVCMKTSLGEMVFALESAKAPTTVTNFLNYVNSGFYKDTVFHRILVNFVVQGGGYTYSAGSYPDKTPTFSAIPLEAPSVTGLSNTAGTIAMARTSDLNSATSQFFINTVNNASWLDSGGGGYAVFGSLISGAATLNALKSVQVQSNGSELSLPVGAPPTIQWAIQLK